MATLNSDILHGARRPSLLRSNINLLKYTNTIDNIKLHVHVQHVKPGWFSSVLGSRSSRIKVMFKLICHMRCISVFTKVLNLSSPNDGKGKNQGHSNRQFSSLTPISHTFKAKHKININSYTALAGISSLTYLFLSLNFLMQSSRSSLLAPETFFIMISKPAHANSFSNSVGDIGGNNEENLSDIVLGQ